MDTKPNLKNKKDDDTNYSFLLKCMAGVGAALIAAGAITAMALSFSAKTAATGMAVGATATAFSVAPIIPIMGIAVLIIASICVLPLLFSNNSTYVVGGSSGYRNSGFFGSSMFTPSVIFTPGGGHHHHHHGHGGGGIFGEGTVHHGNHSGGSHHHGHDGGHSHSGGGHVHGHR
ncbi:hypothetical protein Lmor_2350 [Legionella moravica]|uniref:Transmembrane protein n=1 Tax=Legionella moravica TaxID=39962 RepID=A0A378JWW1_9GAMM|nr:hypothetical protein [Legionella moravica]KTD32412.1 hypothetical protein Lmor_2350 [Legionella moravica]STX62507.1 Uncharacterised protein [Legionella moravica]